MKKVLASLLTLVTFLSVMQLNVSEANPYTAAPAMGILSPNPSWERCYSNASVPLKIGLLLLNNSVSRVYAPKVSYSLDNGENITLTNATEGEHWAKASPLQPTLSFTFSSTLYNLAEGNHTLNAYYSGSDGKVLIDELIFTVDSSYRNPELTLISPKKQNYTSSNVDLIFYTNKDYKNARYILDYHLDPSARYIHIDGNTTLANLTDGLHKIIVFADCVDRYHSGLSVAQGTSFNVSINEDAAEAQINLPIEYKPTFSTTATIAVIMVISCIALGCLIIKKRSSKQFTS